MSDRRLGDYCPDVSPRPATVYLYVPTELSAVAKINADDKRTGSDEHIRQLQQIAVRLHYFTFDENGEGCTAHLYWCGMRFSRHRTIEGMRSDLAAMAPELLEAFNLNYEGVKDHFVKDASPCSS